MTENLFFDTDCLSSFLWVGREDIILKFYRGRIVVPRFVYNEFSNPGVRSLRDKIDSMIQSHLVIIMEIQSGTEEAVLFQKMTKTPDPGHAVIGKGEASALALAKVRKGIAASNNLRDVKRYAEELGVKWMTTADILIDAFSDCYISEAEANKIWREMLAKRRKLPAESFSEYLRML